MITCSVASRIRKGKHIAYYTEKLIKIDKATIIYTYYIYNIYIYIYIYIYNILLSYFFEK